MTAKREAVEVVRRLAMNVEGEARRCGKRKSRFIALDEVMFLAHGVEPLARLVLAALDELELPRAVGCFSPDMMPLLGAVLGQSRYLLSGFMLQRFYGHGDCSWQAFGPKPDDKMTVALLAGVTASGAAALRAIKAVGHEVECVISCVDMLEGAEAALASQGVTLVPLMTIRDIEDFVY